LIAARSGVVWGTGAAEVVGDGAGGAIVEFADWVAVGLGADSIGVIDAAGLDADAVSAGEPVEALPPHAAATSIKAIEIENVVRRMVPPCAVAARSRWPE
jgi:hypothetical protein